MTARLDDVEETDQVATDVGVRVLERVPDARLCRHVQHRCERVLSKQCLHRFAVRQVDPGEREPVAAVELRKAVPLELDAVVIVEVVETDDLVAAAQQGFAEVIADETGRSCYQACTHGLEGPTGRVPVREWALLDSNQ